MPKTVKNWEFPVFAPKKKKKKEEEKREKKIKNSGNSHVSFTHEPKKVLNFSGIPLKNVGNFFKIPMSSLGCASNFWNSPITQVESESGYCGSQNINWVSWMTAGQ